MNIFMNKVASKLSDYKQKGISIPVTSIMLEYVLKEKLRDEIEMIEVNIQEEGIKISGLVRKMKLPITFTITLWPEGSDGRTLYFSIRKFTPLNSKWIKEKIFNNQSSVSYENEIIAIDLNQIEKVKNISIGSIKDFKIKNDILLVVIGI